MTDITDTQRQAYEAAAFRRLVEHLRNRTDVQNFAQPHRCSEY